MSTDKQPAKKVVTKTQHATNAIAQTVPEFFFLYDLRVNTITYLSPQFYDLAQPSLPDSLYEQLKTHIHPEDHEQLANFFTDLVPKNNYTGKIELRSSSKMEHIRCLEIYTYPVGQPQDGEEITELVGHIQDVTSRNNRLELLEQENQKLDHIIKILGHDLRSPFNKISLIADLLKRNMTDEEYRRHSRFLTMLEDIKGHSVALLEQLLNLASVQGEAKHIQFKRFDARELVDQAIENYSLQAKVKKIKLVAHKPDIQVAITADQLLLEQVVKNLMNNALKFTPAGGQITLRIKLFEPEKMELTVTDTGIGIAPKDIPHLFKEFTRIRKQGLNGEPSVGLGLAICKQIITLHKGKIWVEIPETGGTRFIIQVPC
jgi:two-component system sensor histidine kinase VicK